MPYAGITSYEFLCVTQLKLHSNSVRDHFYLIGGEWKLKVIALGQTTLKMLIEIAMLFKILSLWTLEMRFQKNYVYILQLVKLSSVCSIFM